MKAGLLLTLSLVAGSCASPVAGVWPPEPGAPTHRIVVSMDRWHSVVGIWPANDPRGADMGGFREWGYADRSFYLDGNQGSSGSCGALFWPTAGVLQVARAGVPFYRRSSQPPGEHWTFELSEQGYRRLIRFLEVEKAGGPPISRVASSDWHDSVHWYHTFHHCHHWTARALRAAGLPVWSFYALFRWSLAAQLNRAASW